MLYGAIHGFCRDRFVVGTPWMYIERLVRLGCFLVSASHIFKHFHRFTDGLCSLNSEGRCSKAFGEPDDFAVHRWTSILRRRPGHTHRVDSPRGVVIHRSDAKSRASASVGPATASLPPGQGVERGWTRWTHQSLRFVLSLQSSEGSSRWVWGPCYVPLGHQILQSPSGRPFQIKPLEVQDYFEEWYLDDPKFGTSFTCLVHGGARHLDF